MCRVVIEVDRATQIDPAHQRSTIFVTQRSNLDLLPIRADVGPSHGLWRRHHAPGVAHRGLTLVLRRVGKWLTLEPHGGRIARNRFDGEVVITEAVEALTEDLPREQTP